MFKVERCEFKEETPQVAHTGNLKTNGKNYSVSQKHTQNQSFTKRVQVAGSFSPRVQHKESMHAHPLHPKKRKRSEFVASSDGNGDTQATFSIAKKHIRTTLSPADLFARRQEEKKEEIKAVTERETRDLLREIETIQTDLNAGGPAEPPKHVSAMDIDRVLSKFMGIMSRIVEQIGGEAEELYLEIEQSTKQMEFLTDFRSKLGAVTAPLDLLGKDAALKADFDKAIALGVKIDPAKTTYDADEKKVLVEAVGGKRESMVHVSQQQRMRVQDKTQKTTETYTMWSSLMKSLHSAVMRILEHLVTGR